jgi:hypothetical protein
MFVYIEMDIFFCLERADLTSRTPAGESTMVSIVVGLDCEKHR